MLMLMLILQQPAIEYFHFQRSSQELKEAKRRVVELEGRCEDLKRRGGGGGGGDGGVGNMQQDKNVYNELHL